MVCQPLGGSGHVWCPGAHGSYAGIRQIAVGLFPITTVGPQPCKIGGHHQRTRRATDSAKPLPGMTMLGQVLRQMLGGGQGQSEETPVETEVVSTCTHAWSANP